MKKFVALMFVALFTAGVWAHQYEATIDGMTWYYNRISDGKGGYAVEITYRGSYSSLYSNEYSGSLTIPSTLGGYKVTSIASSAFYDCRSLTSITIPDSVTSIGSYAFEGCSSLTSVTIPDSVTTIGEGAFNGCSALASVTIPNSVTSIGSYAFYNCSSLTSIKIPESVTTIGEGAFNGCSALASVTIPNSVTSIGYGAFYGTPFYDNQPDGLVILENGCLYKYKGTCPSSVAIPNSVTTIGDGAFYYCSSLTSITIPNSVTSIGAEAFDGCSSLKEIIGWRPGCPKNVERIVISDSVTSIGSSAFYNCSSLATVTIPDSVTTIGYRAFYNCSSLKEVHITDLAKWCAISFASSDANPCYYAKHLYLNGEEIKDLVVPDSVTTIGSSAFYNCSSLASVTIPNSVTTIGSRAFDGCSSLASVTIPNSVTTIGSSAFYYCSSLTSITIPDSVTTIDSYTFDGCRSLTSVTIPDSVTTIGEFAFYYCSSLTSVTIPNGVTEIGYRAFEGCRSLTSITIPKSVTTIGYRAFDGCSSLKEVRITDLAKWCAISFGSSDANPCYYAEHLYLNGEEIKDLVVPDSVTTIGSYAFYGCISLTSVTIPDSVTLIGSYAFEGCSSLKTVYVDSEDANRVKELMRGKGVGVDALTFVEPPKATIAPISGTTFEASLSISITCDSESATIYYTTDGSEPTMKSTQYTKRFRINGKTTIKARAFFDDGRSSNVVMAEYALGQCPEPVVSTTGGETFYHKGNQVSIAYDCAEGVVRYTTDGSEPTKESPIYTAPFTTDESMVVKAKAFSDNYFDSEVVTATLTREWEPVATPVISAAESFTGSKTKVELTCATEGAIIHYTVDGCEPNSHSKRYLGPFEVRETTTVKAYAILADYTDSEVAAKTITKNWGIGDSVGLPDHKFTTEGVSGWVDDRGVMKSGAILHNETSILKSTFVGKGKLAFEIKLACEEDDPEYMEFDHYELWIDGAMAYKMDGVHDWTACSYDLSEGAHEIEWRYVKDEQDDPSTPNPDGVWLRNIVWSPEKTQASEVKVELAWLKTYFPSLSSYYFDYEEKADETAANGLKVWEAYLIGLDPTDSAAKFVSSITIEDGKPVVSWDPDLGGARTYTILGSTDLKTWTKVEEGRASDYNFFKVSVEMK